MLKFSYQLFGFVVVVLFVQAKKRGLEEEKGKCKYEKVNEGIQCEIVLLILTKCQQITAISIRCDVVKYVQLPYRFRKGMY
jgi:hypothetical protein